MSLEGKCLFPLGHPTGPSPESARGEWSVGKAQGPGPRSEGCGARMEAWMPGTDNTKLLRTLAPFVAVLFFLLIFSWVFPRILSFASKTSAVIPHFSSPYKASHRWCTVQNDPSHTAMEVTSHSYQCFSVQLWHSCSSLWCLLILRMIQNYLNKNTQCLAGLEESKMIWKGILEALAFWKGWHMGYHAAWREGGAAEFCPLWECVLPHIFREIL